MTDRLLHFSLYASLHDTYPHRTTIVWDQIGQLLQFWYTDKKESVALWSPAELQPERTRCNDAVVAIHAAVIDFDDVPEYDWRRCLDPRLGSLRHVLHTTWQDFRSRVHGKRRLRLVLDLSRPVRPKEWEEFYKRLVLWVGCIDGVDKKASDLSRVYYFPSGPEGAGHGEMGAFLRNHTNGRPFDVDALLNQHMDDLRGERPTLRQLSRIARRFENRRSEKMQTLGRQLRRLAVGERYADPGERDDVSFKLAAHLVSELRGAVPEEVVEIFRPSLLGPMASDPEPLSVDTIREKVGRLAAGEEKLRNEDSAARRRWRECLRRARRSLPYSEDEALEIAAGIGIPRKDLDNSWVVQKDKQYWLLSLGDDGRANYRGPYSIRDVAQKAEVVLAPADSLGVICQVPGRNRITVKAPGNLVADHGRVVDEVVRDLAAKKTTLDLRRDRLHLAVRPLRPLEPRYYEEIAEWLSLLGGRRHDRLLDWLWSVPQLDEPTAALYLHGESGIGKNLLAAGLSRLWSESGVTSLGDALSPFNAPLAKTCPLAFGDEKIPTRGVSDIPKTEELRELIGAHQHRYRDLYESTSVLLGAARVLIGANNGSLLVSQGELTCEDIRAICNRILYIRCIGDQGARAREFLIARGGAPALSRWVLGDQLAQHVLYLRDTRSVTRGLRFLVDGDEDSPLVRAMITGTGLRSAVCHWLVCWLLRPDSAQVGGDGLLRASRNAVHISARGLHERWTAYEVSWRGVPRISSVRAALEGLSDGRENFRVADCDVGFYRIKMQLLSEWAARHGFASGEDLANRAQALERGTVALLTAQK